jgi:RecA-family ATPase
MKPLIIISPAKLHGRPPRRQWIVPDWIPCGVVTGLYGDGGLGKSLLALQLQTATALGAPWLGLDVEKVASLGVYCEDSQDELWRRQEDICASYRVERDSLENAHWLPRLGEDNLLMTVGRSGAGELTPFHKQVLAAALDLKARLVIVDTAADVFAGNENSRPEVRHFVARALGSIALKIDGAVVVCAHPSRAGMNTGSGDSGSTAWNASFRSRLYFREPKPEEGETPDRNARILEIPKANYAARGGELRLRWRDGVIEPEPVHPLAGMTPFGKLDAQDVFLDLLRDFEAQNRPISDNLRAGNYAPRLFASMPRERHHGFKIADFAKAMERLFKDRKIGIVSYGHKGDDRHKIALNGHLDELADDAETGREFLCRPAPFRPSNNRQMCFAAVLRRFGQK